MGAAGWIGALIPVFGISGVIVGTYVAHGAGSPRFRRTLGLCYLGALGLSAAGFVETLRNTHGDAEVFGPWLLAFSVVVVSGFLMPTVANRIVRRGKVK